MDILNGILGLFGGSTVAIILKLVLGVLALGGGVFLFWWLDQQKKQQAAQETEKNRTDSQSSVDDKNKQIFGDAKSAEDDIENRLKK